MSGPLDFTNQNIENTYQRVLQTDGTNIYDGTGSLFTVTAVAAPAGPNQSIQFNDAGVTSGSGDFIFNKNTNVVSLTGSINALYGFTGSLLGTAATASNTPNALVTGSITANVITLTKGDGSSFNLTVNTGSGGTPTPTGSLLVTASASANQITFTKGDSSQFTITVDTGSLSPIDTGSFVTTSSFNSFTSSYNSFTASYNTGSFTGSFTGSLLGTSSWATNALTASFITASNVYGPFGSNSILSASYASQSLSSSFATTASYINILRATGSDTQIQYNNNGLLGASSNFRYSNGDLFVLNNGKIYQGDTFYAGIIGPTGQKTVNERGIYSEDSEGPTQYPIVSYDPTDQKYYFADYKVNYNPTNTSLSVTGSLRITGSTQGGGSGHILTYNTSSGEIFFTASSAIGGGGNTGGNSVGSSLYLFNNF